MAALVCRVSNVNTTLAKTYLEETDLALERWLYLVHILLGDHDVAARAHGALSEQVLLHVFCVDADMIDMTKRLDH